MLAAGEGTRLRPLTLRRPKALCPVGTVPLVDQAIARVRHVATEVAVNVHHGRDQLEPHLARLHVEISVEHDRLLGTSGAIGRLAGWIDGRHVLVTNADAWTDADLAPFVDEWDGERVAVLVHGPETFGPGSGVVASLLPAPVVARLDDEPSHLYWTCWKPALAADRLQVAHHLGHFVDCGTPRSYLRANLAAIELAGGLIVDPSAEVTGTVELAAVGAGARVEGAVVRSVVWDGAGVASSESLRDAIRTDAGTTVLVR